MCTRVRKITLERRSIRNSMNRIGRALIFIGQVILFLVVLALIVIASILLYDAFVYALTLIGIPKIIAQLIITMLCLFVTIGG